MTVWQGIRALGAMMQQRISFLVLAGLASLPALAQVQSGDPSAAKPLVTSLCAACHGPDGNSPIPVNPNLARQHPEYLARQLTAYKSGERKNAIMQPIAAGLSEQDIRNLAAYFSGQTPRVGVARDTDLAEAGQKLYRGGNASSGVPACAACHSPTGTGVPAPFPRLEGQHADYTVAQLRAYRSGERVNDPNSIMRTIASRMTEAEINAVAEYTAGLK
jgi:cytochrome c553